MSLPAPEVTGNDWRTLAAYVRHAGSLLPPFLSLEGGIESVEFLERTFRARSTPSGFTMNDLGVNRIGALTTSSTATFSTSAFYSAKDASDDSITYIGTTSNNLGVEKTWSKVERGRRRETTASIFSLELTNLGDTGVDLGDMAIAAGSAAPVFEGERAELPHLLLARKAASIDSEVRHLWFDGGFFSKEKSEYREAKEGRVEFSGVENQFFATIVSPDAPYPATVRVSPKKITLKPPRALEGKGATLLNNYLSLPNETLAGNARQGRRIRYLCRA